MSKSLNCITRRSESAKLFIAVLMPLSTGEGAVEVAGRSVGNRRASGALVGAGSAEVGSGALVGAGSDEAEARLGALVGAGSDEAEARLGALVGAGSDEAVARLGALVGAGSDEAEARLGALVGAGVVSLVDAVAREARIRSMLSARFLISKHRRHIPRTLSYKVFSR
jgi:hypothetical protein